MSRGILRVYLGSATGVGKTFAMLEEGHRLASSGSDVVIGVVETHERTGVARCADGLPVAPRPAVESYDTGPGEFDLDALLERQPSWAIIDELAHTNAPALYTRNAGKTSRPSATAASTC
jgi:two-component system sensor histidine kinase KdpD